MAYRLPEEGEIKQPENSLSMVISALMLVRNTTNGNKDWKTEHCIVHEKRCAISLMWRRGGNEESRESMVLSVLVVAPSDVTQLMSVFAEEVDK